MAAMFKSLDLILERRLIYMQHLHSLFDGIGKFPGRGYRQVDFLSLLRRRPMHCSWGQALEWFQYTIRKRERLDANQWKGGESQYWETRHKMRQSHAVLLKPAILALTLNSGFTSLHRETTTHIGWLMNYTPLRFMNMSLIRRYSQWMSLFRNKTIRKGFPNKRLENNKH